jgi:hypothetical protein
MRLSTIGLVLVAACRPALTFVPDRLPDAAVGRPYHATVEVRGGETPVGNVYATTALPPGLAIHYDKDKRDGIASIDGTPTAAGRTSVTIEAWCYGTNRAGQTNAHDYELTVQP